MSRCIFECIVHMWVVFSDQYGDEFFLLHATCINPLPAGVVHASNLFWIYFSPEYIDPI